MRISDWSSDVCSSDLVEAEHHIVVPRGQHPGVIIAPAITLDHNQMLPVDRTDRARDALEQRRQRGIALLLAAMPAALAVERSEEHTSELQSLMRISYAVFCLKKKTQPTTNIYKQTLITKYHK